MEVIRGANISEIWPKIIEAIVSKGEIVWDEENHKSLEVLNLISNISGPHNEDSMLTANMDIDQAKEAEKWFLDSDAAAEYEFIPGLRIYDFFSLNQWELAISTLKNFQGSRRASIFTCNPVTDWNTERPPSLLLLDFKMRNDVLNMSSMFRSNDMFRTWPLNSWGLSKLLEKACSETGAQAGEIIIHSASAHIYIDDLDEARATLKALTK